MSEVEVDDQQLPPLTRDRAFLGLTATQLLGAFNDNVFKQLLVLYYLGMPNAKTMGDTYQAVAFMVFSLPFVLFSGVAGWWSDRVVKRDIVIGAKLTEIVIMILGLLAFLSGNVYAPFVVLFLMATQSTFFGPSKYGILPEMLRERDLPVANGYIQMTTFLAIIFGVAVAGMGKDIVGDESIWLVCLFCVGVAIVGTTTAAMLRRTPIAHPNLRFSSDVLFLSRETTAGLRRDPKLRNALLVISVFWFVAGVVQLTSNQYGKLQLAQSDTLTSVLQAVVAIGIATGCVVCGQRSRHRVRPEFVQRGALGIAVTLVALGVVGYLHKVGGDPGLVYWASALLLYGMGVSTGFFVVPLQVVLQTRAPRELKGRIIAAQNFFNFIGLFLAGPVYWGLGQVFKIVDLPVSTIFGAMGLLMIAVGAAYRPTAEVEDPAASMSGPSKEADLSTPSEVTSVA